MTRAPSEPVAAAYAECGDCGHWRHLHRTAGCAACGCESFAGGRLRTPARIRLPPTRVLRVFLVLLLLDFAMFVSTGRTGWLLSCVVMAVGAWIGASLEYALRSRRP